MTRFKTIAAAAVAIVSLSAITPAFAAGHYDRYDHREDVRDRRDDRVDARIDRLEDRLAQGRRSGRLTRAEYSRLSSDLNSIESLSHRYERSGRGIDSREMSDLNYRLDRFEQRMVWEKNDRNTAWRH